MNGPPAGDECSSALIVGCGSIGSRHARNLSELGLELSVFDLDEARQTRLASEVDASAPSSLDAALQTRPDVTVVATPSNHHVEPALAAARAGSHLFVEKPLSNDTEGVGELLDVVRDRDLVTMVGSNFRFHPAIETIRELVTDGRVGNVVSARIEAGSYLPEWHPEEDYRDLYSAKEGVGGAVLDFVHELNYARWLFGEAEAVTAMLGRESSLEIETEDTASIVARFEDGTLCEIHLDFVQRAYSRSCHVIGERGTVRWEWEESAVRRYDSRRESWVEEAAWGDDWEVNRMYRDEMEHFLRCAAEHRETRTPLTEGRADLELALAAKESAATGRHVRL
ncbi:Gfo/Idh/MocA family protein [Halorussus sp. MSC15.2]|uniref:Gfo/Idh/MocA family protein n=1 Tax=Halorussus sp. MSC15.2 TaxID=2283638 RepID=UPI0013D412D9|nr:Gfo/Idh/MocA family oxidoreductase [Halorussus sp. MSC15.2]NEU58112.1 Gfo/Idh/MocA family oxidoreductase [Halorussus sp. MSC15.2]